MESKQKASANAGPDGEGAGNENAGKTPDLRPKNKARSWTGLLYSTKTNQ